MHRLIEKELERQQSEKLFLSEIKRCEAFVDDFMAHIYPHKSYVNALSMSWVVKFAVIYKLFDSDMEYEKIKSLVEDKKIHVDLSQFTTGLNAVIRPALESDYKLEEVHFLADVLINRLKEIKVEYEQILKSK